MGGSALFAFVSAGAEHRKKPLTLRGALLANRARLQRGIAREARRELGRACRATRLVLETLELTLPKRDTLVSVLGVTGLQERGARPLDRSTRAGVAGIVGLADLAHELAAQEVCGLTCFVVGFDVHSAPAGREERQHDGQDGCSGMTFEMARMTWQHDGCVDGNFHLHHQIDSGVAFGLVRELHLPDAAPTLRATP